MAEKPKLTDVVTMIVTAVMLLVVVMAPALGNAKRKAARIRCVSFTKQMGLSFRIFANDNRGLNPMQVPAAEGGAMEDVLAGRGYRAFQVMSNELSVPAVLACPSDSREPAADWDSLDNTNISYLLGIDAIDTKLNMLLTGDRNLQFDDALLSGVVNLGNNPPVSWTADTHEYSGNIGLADGSVQQVNTELLHQALRTSGDTTNRVLFPQ